MKANKALKTVVNGRFFWSTLKITPLSQRTNIRPLNSQDCAAVALITEGDGVVIALEDGELKMNGDVLVYDPRKQGYSLGVVKGIPKKGIRVTYYTSTAYQALDGVAQLQLRTDLNFTMKYNLPFNLV